jgi:hypothetical protein
MYVLSLKSEEKLQHSNFQLLPDYFFTFAAAIKKNQELRIKSQKIPLALS